LIAQGGAFNLEFHGGGSLLLLLAAAYSQASTCCVLLNVLWSAFENGGNASTGVPLFEIKWETERG